MPISDHLHPEKRHDDVALCFQPLTHVARLVREGVISPVQLTEACLDRIETLDDRIHAFLTVTARDAYAQAEQAEREINRGYYRGPLHGIPIAHKDIIATKGVRTTAHSRSLYDWVPDHDATVITRLRDAGAISLGKTALHEYAVGSPGLDEAFPAARNPWNLNHAPGSSSSGSGAAVAAGFCFAATGTDTGGSVRHPASACGLVGMKPTFGSVSNYGVIPLAPTLDHVGPLTRTVADNAVVLEVLLAYDSKDSNSVSHPGRVGGLIGRPMAGRRVGVPRRYIEGIAHDSYVIDTFATALQLLRELGAVVSDVEIDGLDSANDDAALILNYEAYQYHKDDLARRPEVFGATFVTRVKAGARVYYADYEAARRRGESLRQSYNGLFAAEFDVIVSPGRESAADTMADLLANPARRGLTNRMYNLSGNPALTLPMGFDGTGLPLGLQIAAAHFREDMVYQIAAAYELAAGWYKSHPVLQ